MGWIHYRFKLVSNVQIIHPILCIFKLEEDPTPKMYLFWLKSIRKVSRFRLLFNEPGHANLLLQSENNISVLVLLFREP